MSDWVPSDDRPLIDVPLPSTPTPKTEALDSMMNMNDEELNRILGLPQILPQQQSSPVLLIPEIVRKPDQSGTSLLGTGPRQPNKSWQLFREAMSTPTTSRSPFTPPITPPMTPQTSPVERNYQTIDKDHRTAPDEWQSIGDQMDLVRLGYGQSTSTAGAAALSDAGSPERTYLQTSPQNVLRNYQMDDRGHRMPPAGWQPTQPLESQSAELNVSSDISYLTDEDIEDNPDVLQRLSLKTNRDLNKLKQKGFEVNYSPQSAIGSGRFGEVFVGTYTPGISDLTDKQGRYIGNIQPGQQFAAKYIQTDEFECRVCHEIEKQVLKRLAKTNHPNIVSFKIAINLGIKRPVIHKSNNNYFYSYDRMFLIMDLADRGSLEAFNDNHDINDLYAIQFTKDMSNGMLYMHDNGIIHGDPHWGNVLLFSAPNAAQIVAKWVDFGQSLARDHWSGADLTDKEFHDLKRGDIDVMVSIINSLLYFAQNDSTSNTGVYLQPVKDLTFKLSFTNDTLDTIMPAIRFGI